MKAYKLLRVAKDGQLHPLFINRKTPTPFGVWMKAECYPTKGFAVRQGWHCTLLPRAKHLAMQLASGEKRIWCEVEIEDYEFYQRPEKQGGIWALAQQMKVNRVLASEEVEQILCEADNG